MELTALREAVMQSVGALISFSGDTDGLGEALLSCVESHDLGAYSAYIDAVNGDLETDYLQRIFQYDRADRTEKCQDFTPPSIARLLSVLTDHDVERVVYDLCAGSGALTIQSWARNPKAVFVCEELDAEVIPYLLFNLCARNISGWVIHRDALTLELFGAWQLKSGVRFSTASKSNAPWEILADRIISNPPYNITWEPPAPLLADERFSHCDMPPKNNANWAFVLTALARLSKDGKCAFVLPNGVLTGSDGRAIREYIVQNGLLERVVMMPERMFEATSIPVSVLVFSRGNQNVTFIDSRTRCEKDMRDQKGQYGGKSHTARTYHKEVNILTDAQIEQIAMATDEPGFCATVPIDRIKDEDWLLTPPRYIVSRNADIQAHRPFTDIIDDINRISRERNVVRVTMNETLARQNGFAELYEDEQRSVEITEDMAKSFRLFGREPIKPKWLALTKDKNVIRFENQDKELLSSLFEVLLFSWKAHMHYLNNEENRLLAEFRDALLPELMSGAIRLDVEEVKPA